MSADAYQTVILILSAFLIWTGLFLLWAKDDLKEETARRESIAAQRDRLAEKLRAANEHLVKASKILNP